MTDSQSPTLDASTSGFVLAAAITMLFNTALAWAKDAYAPLNRFMQSLTGHHWTTHGLADLILFIGLGFLFTKTKAAQWIDAGHLIRTLVACVVIAALGLGLWYVLV